MPKFLQDDLKLFTGIVSDLFPNIREEPIDYGTLEESIRNVCKIKCLKDVDGERFGFCQKLLKLAEQIYFLIFLLLFYFFAGYITKVIQLYETTVVRHGLMLVGPSGSGKTKVTPITLNQIKV